MKRITDFICWAWKKRYFCYIHLIHHLRVAGWGGGVRGEWRVWGGGCNYVMHYYIETYMCVDAFACSAHMRVIFMQTFKYSIAWWGDVGACYHRSVSAHAHPHHPPRPLHVPDTTIKCLYHMAKLHLFFFEKSDDISDPAPLQSCIWMNGGRGGFFLLSPLAGLASPSDK